MNNLSNTIKTTLFTNAKATKGLKIAQLSKAFDATNKTNLSDFERNLKLAKLVASAKQWLTTIEAKDLMRERDIKCNISSVCEANGMWSEKSKNAYMYARVGKLDDKVVDGFIESRSKNSDLSLSIKALDKFAKGKSEKKESKKFVSSFVAPGVSIKEDEEGNVTTKGEIEDIIAKMESLTKKLKDQTSTSYAIAKDTTKKAKDDSEMQNLLLQDKWFDVEDAFPSLDEVTWKSMTKDEYKKSKSKMPFGKWLEKHCKAIVS
jgi:hypothetical protein